LARGTVVAALIGLVGAGVSGLGGFGAPGAGAVGSTPTTPTTAVAPSPSQISTDQARVNSIEASLAEEEQQSALLDDRYDTAVEAEQNAQAQLAVISTKLVQTKTQVDADKRRLTSDAIKAYVYGTPQSQVTSLFTSSADLGDARTQYTKQIVGDLNSARQALETSETELSSQQSQQQNLASEAQSQANQARLLAEQNQQAASAAQATLATVKGQLAQEVLQAAVVQAQQKAAAAAQSGNGGDAGGAQAAAAVAAAVGGTAGAASAAGAANQAGGGVTPSGPVGGSTAGTNQGRVAANAAVSQLGVPYIWGGETPWQGFDCSGLVQWAWSQSGVWIPRTTETQWAALPHVSLAALEPGDLLFYYDLDGDNQVDHVVMYVGSGPWGSQTVIQAPSFGSTVSYSPIWSAGLIGAARP